jgi:hypothetical protein
MRKKILLAFGLVAVCLLLSFLMITESSKLPPVQAAQPYQPGSAAYNDEATALAIEEPPDAPTLGPFDPTPSTPQAREKGGRTIHPVVALAKANLNSSIKKPTYTEAEVRKFFQKTGGLGLIGSSTPVTVEKVEFITAAEVDSRIPGVGSKFTDSLYAANADLECFVTLKGTFSMGGGPVLPGQTKEPLPTFPYAYAVFDALTGNILMMGGL